MNRSLALAVLALASYPIMPSNVLTAAEPPPAKGFDVDGGAAKGEKAQEPIVVGLPAEVKVLKIWEPEAASDSSDNLVSGVESIELLSTNRLRWTFSLWNQADHAKRVEIDMNKSYVADAKGESYQPVAREFVHNDVNGYRTDIQARQKFKFRLEFVCPPKPTRQFRVGLVGVVIGGRRLPQFDLKLEEPIAKPNDEEKKVTPPGRVVRKKAEPVGTAAQLQALRDVYEKGQTFEGDIKAGGKVTGKATLVFERTPDDGRPLFAMLSSKDAPAFGIELMGRLVEDSTAPLKVCFAFLAEDGTVIRFQLKDDRLEGTDSKNRELSLKAK